MHSSASLIEQIHRSGQRLVIAVTGGGSHLISDLLTVPGASQSVLEACVPYSSSALNDWLGAVPDSYCSRRTALSMASVAWWRARRLLIESGAEPRNSLGIACTASLASNRPKRGEHRFWIALQSDSQSVVASATLEKGRRSRAQEEHVVADVLLYLTAEVCGVADRHVPVLAGDETIVVDVESPPEPIARLHNGVVPCVWSLPDVDANGVPIPLGQAPVELPRGLLCGSFNPLHRGHLGMREAATELLGGPVAFELSIVNADKPPLNFFEIESRRRQFARQPLVLTSAPLFADKSRLFPGVTFVIGFDTAERVLQPRFYGGTDAPMIEALRGIQSRDCRFLVAGRATDGGFQTLADLHIPDALSGLFDAIPEALFRDDISSSELRRQKPQSESER